MIAGTALGVSGFNRHGDIVALISWGDGVTPAQMGVLSRKRAGVP